VATSPNGRYHDEKGHEYALVDGERVYTDRMRGFAPSPIPKPYIEREPAFLPRDTPTVKEWDEEEPQPDPFEVYDTPEILTFEVPAIGSLPVLGRDGLIMEGGTNLLYSYPKTGKTELLTALTHDWVAGRRILYLTEEPIPNWKRRLTAHGFTPADYTLRMAYAWGFRVDRAVALFESETFDVLVVDTLRNTVGFVEADGDKDVARVMVPLFRAAGGKTVICSYHARKMPGEGGRDISGHHSLYGAFDRAIQLAPVEGKETHRRLTVSGRCMYDGDMTLEYRQTEPCRFEVLDALTVTSERKGPRFTLECLECGDEFRSNLDRAKFCSKECRQRNWRRTKTQGVTVSDDPARRDATQVRTSDPSRREDVDALWLDRLTE
jgi:hypothetical protein